MNKIKIIALFGKAGSGKDTVLKELVKQYPHIHEIVSCTTRPPRAGEVDGINYHFLTNQEFADKVINNDMLEATVFNDWCYGTAYSDLDPNNINVGVFNPEGISILQDDPRIEIIPYLIVVSDKERLLRQLNREANPDVLEIVRRFNTDNIDFDNLEAKVENFVALFNHDQEDLQYIVRELGQLY